MQSLPSKAKYWGTFNMMTLVWLLAAAGVGVALIVYQFFSRQHYQHYVDVLANMCDERARMLQHQFSVSMNHVHALAILVSTFYVGRHPTALNQVRMILVLNVLIYIFFSLQKGEWGSPLPPDR